MNHDLPNISHGERKKLAHRKFFIVPLDQVPWQPLTMADPLQSQQELLGLGRKMTEVLTEDVVNLWRL